MQQQKFSLARCGSFDQTYRRTARDTLSAGYRSESLEGGSMILIDGGDWMTPPLTSPDSYRKTRNSRFDANAISSYLSRLNTFPGTCSSFDVAYGYRRLTMIDDHGRRSVLNGQISRKSRFEKLPFLGSSSDSKYALLLFFKLEPQRRLTRRMMLQLPALNILFQRSK